MNATLATPPGETTVGNYFVSNYPPFSTWDAEYIPKFLEQLANPSAGGGEGERQASLGLYVHIPFCRHRCHYCYFRVYPRRHSSDVNRYIDAVLNELSLYLAYPGIKGRRFTTAYFGGGSPSYLTAEQLRRLLGGLQERSSWDAVQECTFECEPGSVTSEKLQILKQLGVTRLSLGFQTLDDHLLRRSGRDVRVDDCMRAFTRAREAGFDEINIDLLAGLPGETEKSWERTISQVLELVPDCITIYQLELTYNSGLYHAIELGRDVQLPSWKEKQRWVGQAFAICEEAGYTIGSGYMAIRNPKHWRFIYTVENFWHGKDLLALGETAFGHLNGVHYQNADTFDQYVRSLEQGKLPLRRAYALSDEEKLRREVILHLKTGALDVAYFRQKFGVELVEHFNLQFEQLRDLFEFHSDSIRLTREGLLQVDWLLPKFYLPEHVGIRYT